MYVGEDLDVLLELCDRIVVLCGGQVSGVVDARTTDKREVGALMTRVGGGKRRMHKKQNPYSIFPSATHCLWYQALGRSAAVAILLALIVCALVTMLMTGENPHQRRMQDHSVRAPSAPPARHRRDLPVTVADSAGYLPWP